MDWLGLTRPKPGKLIKVTLWLNRNMDPAALFHLVGHEMVHVNQIVTGTYNRLLSITGERGLPLEKQVRTNAHMEMEAYWWNIVHLSVLRFPGAKELFYRKWFEYYDILCG